MVKMQRTLSSPRPRSVAEKTLPRLLSLRHPFPSNNFYPCSLLTGPAAER